jgi:hypothetical protein
VEADIQVIATPQDFTFPFLPPENITEDADGDCTVIRIIGELWGTLTVNKDFTDQTTYDGFAMVTQFGLLRTEVDDTGTAPQLVVLPFGVPDLGPSASIGGQRQFIWTKALIFDDKASIPSPGPAVSEFVADNYLATRSEPWFDIKRKVRMKSGEALVLTLHVPGVSFPPGAQTAVLHLATAYRILVKTGRR